MRRSVRNIYRNSPQIMRIILNIIVINIAINFCDTEICTSIKDGTEKILAFGELEENFFLVTTTLKTVTISKEDLDTTNNRLHLSGYDFIFLQELYPQAKASLSNYLNKQVFLSTVHYNNVYGYIDLGTFGGCCSEIIVPSKNSILYSYVNKYFQKKDMKTNLISIYGKDYFYGFQSQAEQYPRIISARHSIGNNPQSSYSVISDDHALCQETNSSTGEMYISLNCETYIDWSNKRGFSFKGVVYAFDDNEVAIFPEDMIRAPLDQNQTNKHVKFEATVKRNEEFFFCKDDDVPDENGKSIRILGMPLVLFLIVAAIIFGIVACFAIVIYLDNEAYLTAEPRSYSPKLKGQIRISASDQNLLLNSMNKIEQENDFIYNAYNYNDNNNLQNIYKAISNSNNVVTNKSDKLVVSNPLILDSIEKRKRRKSANRSKSGRKSAVSAPSRRSSKKKKSSKKSSSKKSSRR